MQRVLSGCTFCSVWRLLSTPSSSPHHSDDTKLYSCSDGTKAVLQQFHQHSIIPSFFQRSTHQQLD